MELKEIEIRNLRTNDGSIEGLPKNPRKISKKKLEQLKKSVQDAPEMLRLRELIAVESDDGYVVICGNQRLEAAKALGMQTLPVKVLPKDTDPAKLREYAIKDNLPFGEDDWEVLTTDWDVAELEEWGMEVPDVWKDTTEAVEDDFNADEVVEVVCQKYDVWQLGRHRLMCGDSTDQNDVAVLMDGKRADLLLTDPPYGIGIDGQKESKCENPKHNRKAHEFRGWDKDRPNKSLFDFILSLNIPSIVFGGNYFADMLPATRGWIYWDKGQNGLSMSDGELAWTNIDKPLRAVICNRANLGNTSHPTQKPIKVISFCIEYADKGDIILDLFGGSGSTLVAAEQLNRTCYMMELDPHYCDIIIARWEKLTGQTAVKLS